MMERHRKQLGLFLLICILLIVGCQNVSMVDSPQSESESSFYTLKAEAVREGPEPPAQPGTEVKAKTVTFGNGYKGLGNPRFNFWVTIPEAWSAYTRSENGDGYYITCDGPGIDMRVYGYNYLPEIEDSSEGEPFLFDSGVQGSYMDDGSSIICKYFSNEKYVICFYIDYSENPAWITDHESEVMAAARSLRDGINLESDDLRAKSIDLQEQFPMSFSGIISPNLKNYLEYTFDETEQAEVYDFLTGGEDLERRKICEYLFYALPGDPLIDYTALEITDGKIPNELLVLAGLHSQNFANVPVYDKWVREMGGNAINNPNAWLGTHIEKAAYMIFGEQRPIEHIGYGNKRYSYDPDLNVYTHFPGGVSMIEYLVPVVDYLDNGDTFSVEVAFIHTGFMSNAGEELAVPSKDTGGALEYFGYDNLAEMAAQRAPRAKVVLRKMESAGFGLLLQSYQYIG